MLSSLKIKLRSIVAQNGVQRYAANTTWMMLEQMARLVAGLLVGVLVARYLGPTQFGELSFAVAFVALFGAVSSLGLDSIVTRELVRDPAKMNSLLGTSFWLKLMGAVLSIIFIIVALKVAGNEYRAALYILIIAVGGMFQAFGVIDFYYQSQVLSKYVSKICIFFFSLYSEAAFAISSPNPIELPLIRNTDTSNLFDTRLSFSHILSKFICDV